MNILILNGSPKGEYSITLQTVRYLELKYPEHEFCVLHVGQRIRSLEKELEPALLALEKAELLLFAYPVYTFMAPYQLHRFIELIKPHASRFAGKFATQVTTSKHFYDVTAHLYVQQNCQDMGLKFISGLSADMDDLLKEKGRSQAEGFFEYAMWCMQNGLFEKPPQPAPNHAPVPATGCAERPAEGGNVAIVANGAENPRLAAMIGRFRAVLGLNTHVFDIAEYPFAAGCLGCFGCAVSGRCVHKDGFDVFLRERIQAADAIVYAFEIADHSMGSRFKLYDDRQFCNGHRTVTTGTPVGYLISGGYGGEQNLKTVIEARAQVGGNFLAGVATNEADPDGEIDALAARLRFALGQGYCPPPNFYGVGGMKIFRDLIWLMQGMMKADHRFFKAHGQYDFPQKQRGTMLKMHLVGALISSEKLKAKIGSRMNEGMIAPYKKLFDKLKTG